MHACKVLQNVVALSSSRVAQFGQRSAMIAALPKKPQVAAETSQEDQY